MTPADDQHVARCEELWERTAAALDRPRDDEGKFKLCLLIRLLVEEDCVVGAKAGRNPIRGREDEGDEVVEGRYSRASGG